MSNGYDFDDSGFSRDFSSRDSEGRVPFKSGSSKLYKRNGSKAILKNLGKQKKLTGKKVVSIVMSLTMMVCASIRSIIM